MTDLQETQIRDYLLLKKLPIDILLEVNDHFIAQIADLKQEKNIDFKTAFELTKISWNEELVTYYPFFGLNKINNGVRTRFEQKMRRKADLTLLTKSFFISVLIFLSFYIGNLILNAEQFVIFFRIIMFSIFGFAFVLFIFNSVFYSFAFKKEHRNFKFSIYQFYFPIVFGLGYFFISEIGSFSDLMLIFGKQYFDLFSDTKILVLFLIILSFIFTGLAQVKFAQTLKKIKPQLKFT